MLIFCFVSTTPMLFAQISGTVFADLDASGSQTSNEPGQSGVSVLAYDAANQEVASTSSAADGTYSLDLPSGAYRLVFSNLQGAYPGPAGNDSGSSVRFINSPASNIDFGVMRPEQFCEANPTIVIPCYVNGDPLLTEGVEPGDQSALADVLVSTTFNATGESPLPGHIAVGEQMGAVWGLAYQRQSQQLFSAAVVKRHTGLGPLGTGGIYMTDFSATNPGTQSFVDLNTLGINTGVDPHQGLTGNKTEASADAQTFGEVAKTGLGDMDISTDGNTLYVLNLNQREIVALEIGNPPATPSLAQVSTFAIPNPGCSNGDYRPWALKYYAGSLYLGMVCSAETSQSAADLTGIIYQMDPASGAFSEVLSFPLDYDKGCTDLNFGCTWNPWTDNIADLVIEGTNRLVLPQPMISDIEFDINGNMLIGMMDRTGHQTGRANLVPGVFGLYNGFAAGDLLKAYNDNGTYILESNAQVGPDTGCGVDGGHGPGGGEFFCEDNWNEDLHEEVVVGGLAYLAGTNEVVSSVFDPLDQFLFSGGLHWYDNATGTQTDGYMLYQNNDPGTQGKATGIGDVELLCGIPDIQIGNRVWADSNANGIQDAGELGLAAVEVMLLDQNGAMITSTTTNAQGEYIFDGLQPFTTYIVKVETGSNVNNLPPSMANNAAGPQADLIDSDGVTGEILNAVSATITTGEDGANDHSVDFGFVYNECANLSIMVAVTCEQTVEGGDGMAVVTITGAVEPVMIQWSNGQTTETATGLSAPLEYSVMVTDAANCSATYDFNMCAADCDLELEIQSVTDVSCNGENDASAALNASGSGSDMLGYVWLRDGTNIGEIGPNASGLAAGEYVVTATNIAGCEAQVSFTIDNPNELTAVTCDAEASTSATSADGSLTVFVTGGTAPYTYNLDGEISTTGTFTGLAPGNYTINVSDTNDCVLQTSCTVPGPDCNLSIAVFPMDTEGCQEDNGSLQINFQGADGPVDIYYTINSGAEQLVESAVSNNPYTISNLGAANYSVRVATASCEASTESPVSISGAEPSVSYVSVEAMGGSCEDENGSITIIANGNAPLSYSVNGGSTFQTSNVFDNLPAGDYQVVVADVNGCELPYGETVSVSGEAAGLSVSNVQVQHVFCAGDADGKITLSISGGTPPYELSSDGGQTFQLSDNFNNLEAGYYELVVMDATGCQISAGFAEVEGPAVPLEVLDVTVTDVDCFGGGNGTLTVIATGGTEPYEYSLDAGDHFLDVSFVENLGMGTYDILVRDANYCTATWPVTVQIGGDPMMISDVIFEDVPCGGSATTTMTIEASGGFGDLLYSIDEGNTYQTSNVFDDVSAGSYLVYIKDQNDCPLAFGPPVIVGGGDENFRIANVSYTQVLCTGANDASITITGDGGVPPYMFSIDNGETYQESNLFENLEPGIYMAVLEDANGCMTGYDELIEITEPPIPLQVMTLDKDNVSCPGEQDGLIHVSAIGGIEPYSFSINGGNTFEDSGIFENLAGGDYIVIINDANGCSITFEDAVVIEEAPELMIGEVQSEDARCQGEFNGSIVIFAAGGTGQLLYSIDGGAIYQTSGTFQNLPAGDYEIIVKDENDCIANYNSTVSIAEAPELLMTYVSTDVTNCDGNNGTISVEASGGLPPYQYTIDNRETFQDTGEYTGLEAGVYIVDIVDANGCSVEDEAVVINDPADFEIVFVDYEDLSLCGADDGWLTIYTSGGELPLEFSIDGGQTYSLGNEFTNLPIGDYEIHVKDALGCSKMGGLITITGPTDINIIDIDTSDPTCFDADNGSIIITAEGGDFPLEYSIDGGQSHQYSNVFENVAPGDYQIIVRSGFSCSTDGPALTLTAPPAIEVMSTIGRNISCNGDSDGQITILAGGGATQLYYSIDNGEIFSTGNTFSNLQPGIYQLLVRDENGCFADYSEVIEISEPAQLEVIVEETNPTTCGGSDGQIEINVVGGTPGYSYSIDGGAHFAQESIISGLIAGTYSVVVRDQNGCHFFDTDLTILEEPEEIHIVAVLAEDVDCQGGDNGSISIYAAGGTGVLLYSVDGGLNYSTDNVFEGLAIGQYDVVVSDQAQCAVEYPTPIVIGDPTSSIVIASVTSTNVNCYGENSGTITIEASGGTGSLGYSIDGGITFHIVQNEFTNLEAGLYSVVVRDANACTTTWNQIINLAQPEDLLLTVASQTDIPCHDMDTGEIVLNVIGGVPPYQYSIDDGLTYQDSPVFTGLAEGIYYAETLDANACNFGEPTPVSIVAPLQLQVLDVMTANQQCAGGDSGTIEIIAGGGFGDISYSIDGGATFTTSPVFNNLAAGTYNVIVRDENNCTDQEDNINLQAAETLEIASLFVEDITDCDQANGAISFVATGGTGAIQYSIDGGSSLSFEPTFTGLAAGTYQPLIVDENGCTSQASLTTIEGINPVEFVDVLSTATSVCGGNDGQITILAQAGSSNLEYSIDGGQTYSTSSAFSNLAEGAYNIMVRDDNNCTTAYGNPIVVTSPPTIFVSNVTTTDASCANANNGQLEISAAGGTTTLEYSIDGGISWQLSNIFDDLAVGAYSIMVRSGNDCMIVHDEEATIQEPSEILVPQVDITEATCSSSADGAIAIFAIGGTGSLSYSIDDGANFSLSSSFTGLPAGAYQVVVQDETGCQSTQTAVSLTGEAAPNITALVAQPACGQTKGQIQMSVDGDNGPYYYSIDFGNNYQLDPNILVDPGSYTVWVRDQNGCVHQLEIGAIDIELADNCASIGDTVFEDLNGNGVQDPGEPGIPGVVVVLYDQDNNLIGTQTTDENGNYLFDNLAPNTYTVDLNDATLPNGFELSTPGQFVVDLSEGEQYLDADFGIYDPSCIEGFVFFDLNGNGIQDPEDVAYIGELVAQPGGGATVNLLDADGNLISTTITSDGTYEFCGLAPGQYTVELIAPDGTEITTGGSSTVTVQSGENTTVDFGLAPINTLIANDDSASTDFETPITIVVTGNDLDPNGDDFTITDYTQPQNGTVSENEDGTLTYTPNDDFCGTDTFTYTITDEFGNTDTATVTVDVACDTNQGPDAVDDMVSTTVDTPVTITPLDNDTDPDGDDFSICGFTQPQNGTVVQLGEEFIYEPNPGFEGTDSFTYTICDEDGNEDTATVYIDVEGPGCLPEMITICTEPLQATYICPEFCLLGDDFEITSVSTSYNCGVEIEDGCLIFTSVPGIIPGFVYEVDLIACNDTQCEAVEIFIQVGNCNGNTSPVAVSDQYETNWSTPIVVDVLNNDYDPDGGDITVCDYFQPTHGSLTMVNGQLIYTPLEGYTGVDHFSYQICDEDGGIDLAIVTVTIGEPGACEAVTSVMVPDIYKVCAGGFIKALQTQPATIPSGYQIIYLLTTTNNLEIQQISNTPTFGPMQTAEYYTIHSLVYNPATVDITQITFGSTTVYEINSLLVQGGGEVCASLSMAGAEFKVVNCNEAPVAVNDLFSTVANSSISFSPLENDLDSEGEELTICYNSDPVNGSLQVVNNEMTYTPNPGFFGVETILYNACDEFGNYGQATITIMVQEGDCANPVLSDCTEPLQTILICPQFCQLTGDYTVTDIQHSYNGNIELEGGCILYTSLPGYSGFEQLIITACDDQQCDATTVYLTVSADCGSVPNSAPVVASEYYTTTSGQPIFIDVLENVNDPEGAELLLQSVGNSTNGTVTINEGGVNYTPGASFTGIDQFSYTVCDAIGACTTGIIIVEVLGENQNASEDASDCAPLPICTSVMTPTLICVDFCNVSDAEIISVQTLFTCSIQNISDNCFTYTGLPAFSGEELLTIEGCNDLGACETVEISLTVGDCDADGFIVDEDHETRKSQKGNCEVKALVQQNSGFGRASLLSFQDYEDCFELPNLRLEIYSMEGILVHTANQEDAVHWNGMIQGKMAHNGLYVFRLLNNGEAISSGQLIK